MSECFFLECSFPCLCVHVFVCVCVCVFNVSFCVDVNGTTEEGKRDGLRGVRVDRRRSYDQCSSLLLVALPAKGPVNDLLDTGVAESMAAGWVLAPLGEPSEVTSSPEALRAVERS